MSKREREWQGSLDGLCGLYSLVFAIKHAAGKRKWRSERILFELLNAAREMESSIEKTLPEIIAGKDSGLHDEQLVTIFNALPDNVRLGFRAKLISEAVPAYDGTMKSLSSLFKVGGTAVIDVDRGAHWVLATRRLPGGFARIYDPSARAAVVRRKRASSQEGVALLPPDISLEI